MPVVKKANTTIGLPGRFAARLQPNDTRDNVDSIVAQIYEGLSYGVGDAVIGINPVTDNVENTKRMLSAVQGSSINSIFRLTTSCVLAHISTQIRKRFVRAHPAD